MTNKRASANAARKSSQNKRAAKNVKRKIANKRAARPSNGRDDNGALPALPNRRSVEGGLWDLFDRGSMSALEQAQDVIYSACDARTRKEAVALAHEALEISADCADAYNLLAEETASTDEEAAELYRQGVAAGERALGPDAFEHDVGSFWGLLDTRPYMRARAGLAMCEWHLGHRDEAVEHARELLRLNPNDNQGVRYTLAGWLMELERHDDLGCLLAEYEDDAMAAWSYARALLAFRTSGDGADARERLRAALDTNPHVPAFLLGKRKLPRRLPDYVGLGDEREAISVADQFKRCWSETAGALDWLQSQI